MKAKEAGCNEEVRILLLYHKNHKTPYYYYLKLINLHKSNDEILRGEPFIFNGTKYKVTKDILETIRYYRPDDF